MTRGWLRAGAAVLLAGVPWIPVDGARLDAPGATSRSPELDLSSFSPAPPPRSVRLLFIHHSCGGQLLAEPGEEVGAHCIYASHPNGGGLRRLLANNGYEVHEASYGSALGERTDLFDWWPKLRDRMDDILACAHQDERYEGAVRNEVVLFKSCFPNNAFVGEGTPPGDPRGPELTVWNARATLTALLPELAKRPEVLFVYVTAPPLAPGRREPLGRWLLKRALGRARDWREQARLARKLDDWVRSPDGWLRGYAHQNVVVFDYYDVLTGDGASDSLAYATGDGTDSHPSSEGNARAAARFVPFLNRAVRRAGLVDAPSGFGVTSATIGEERP